jgi:dephospho-CoA kinase
MKFVAITGSFASGKSFVSGYLENLGYKVFSCDDYVKKLYLDLKIQNDVSKIIGIPAFDKKRIITIIYSDELKRKKLEDYIHPIVRSGIEDFKNKHSTEKILFVEIPLLFETGFNKYFDYSISVYCSEENRLKRAKTRENFNLEIYNKITEVQLPQDEKRKLADFQVNNDLGFRDTEKQIDEIITGLNK